MLTAYAAKLGDQILSDTVHGYPRGSMVNYLYVHARINIPQTMTDEMIRFAWEHYAAGAKIVMVQIDELEEVDVSKGSIA